MAAMVLLGWYTGMRPNEMINMRAGDIGDRDNEVWTYRPESHKTAWRGKDKVIPIGPNAQRVLAPFITGRDPQAQVFDPRQARAEYEQRRAMARKTPPQWGNAPGTNRKPHPKRKPRSKYCRGALGTAVRRACEQAFPLPEPLRRRRRLTKARKSERYETEAEWRERLGPDRWAEVEAFRDEHYWHPYQLRHAAATRLRKQMGIEAARVVLGHSSVTTTEIYAEQDVESAIEAMGVYG